MAGSLSIPNTFATQLGLVPASELDSNYTTIRDYVNNREIAVGLFAARPAAGTAGRWFLATDINGGTLYTDTGAAWVQTAGPVTPVSSGAGGITLYLTPMNATFPNADFPQLSKNIGSQTYDYTLDFDSQTAEAARWEVPIPSNFTVSSASIAIFSRQNSETTGTLGWVVTERAFQIGSTWDQAGTSVQLLPANVGINTSTLLTQTTSLLLTGWGADVMLQFQIHRNVAADTVAADGKFMGAVVRIT